MPLLSLGGFVSISWLPARFGCPLRGRGRFQADVIVHGVLDPPFAPEVTPRRLDGDVTQQKLNLFRFASGLVAQPPHIPVGRAKRN